MKVSEIMTKNVITIDKDETVSKAIAKMDKYDIKELPVLKNNQLIGLITYYDILYSKIPEKTKIDRIMVKPPTLNLNDSIEKALKLILETGIEAIPVLENNKLVGIVSDYDILRKIKIPEYLIVKDVLKKVPKIWEDDKISKVLSIMRSKKIDRLPVFSENKYIGAILLMDILRNYYKRVKKENIIGDVEKFLNLPVKSLVKDIPVVKPLDNLNKVVRILLENKLKGTIVLDKEVVGIINRLDVLRLFYLEEKALNIIISGDVAREENLFMKEIIKSKLEKLFELYGIERIEINVRKKKGRYEINLREFRNGRLENNIEKEGYDLFFTLVDVVKKLEELFWKKYQS